jgi:hypothetical protein
VDSWSSELQNVRIGAVAQIAAPADAAHVAEWVDELGNGETWGRHIRGTRRATAGVEVTLCSWQDASNAVERHASVTATDVELDATALRQLAAMALDAADELDELAAEAACQH